MYIIIYDFGTSSVKTCLFNIDSEIHMSEITGCLKNSIKPMLQTSGN